MKEKISDKICKKFQTNPILNKFFRIRYCWLAALCSALIMLVVYYCYDMAPFGDITILRMDLYHQYGPLFAELYERVTNLQSLFYSWNSGGGSGFLGNFYNYLSSPTAIFMLLFGHENMPEAIAAMVLVKASLAAFTFSYFLYKRSEIQNPLIAAFGVLYSCSGFFIAYYWNIMWLDAFYLLPLVILGIEKLISERKMALYVATLTATLVTNYYMGYMVCIFSVLYYIYYFFSSYNITDTYFGKLADREKGIKGFFVWAYSRLRNNRFFECGVRFAFGSVGAALLSCFALLPVYFILMNCSATSGTFPTEFKTYFSIFDFLANHLAYLEPTIRSSGADVLPNVYCGILTVMLVPLYLFSNKVSFKEKMMSVGLLAVLFASFYTNILNYILHGFHFPNDLPYRFSFVYSFVLLVFAFKAITLIKEYTSRQIIGVGVATIAFVVLVQEIGSKNFKETGVWICIAFIFIYCLALAVLKNRKYPYMAAAALVLFSCCAEYVVANTNNYSMNQAKINFVGDYDDFREMKDIIDEDAGNDDYRMELTSLRARMDPCWYNYNGVSTFTSMAYEKVANMQSHLGMFSNYINSYTYNRQTPVYNAFFALDYIVDNTTVEKPDMNSELYADIGSVSKFTAYKNLYSLPIAFRVNEEIKDWSHDNVNPFEVQSGLFGNSTGIHTVFNDMELTNVDGSGATCYDLSFEDEGYYPYSVENAQNASLSFEYTVKERGNAYIYLKSSVNDIESITVTLPNGTVITQPIDTKPHILDLGLLEMGDIVDIYAPLKNGVEGYVYLYGVTLDNESFKQGYDMLKASSLNVTEFDDTTIKGNINVAEDGVLYTSINYDTSWSVYIDGNKVAKSDILSIGNDALIGVNITAGEHTVEFRYMPEGLTLGVLISVTTLLMFLLMCSIIKTGFLEFKPKLYVDQAQLPSVYEEVIISDDEPQAETDAAAENTASADDMDTADNNDTAHNPESTDDTDSQPEE